MGLTSLCENFSELGTMEPGAFAEYTAVPGRLVHRADGITTEEAALIEPAGNGFHAAEKAGILPGDNVVVIGPGPIGNLAMQCAALYHPGELIVVGTRDSRLALAKKLGASHTINITNQNAAESIMEITKNRGADRIINCATTDSSFELAMKVANKNSTIVMEGLSGSGKPLQILMDDFIIKTVSVVPATGVHTKQFLNVMALVREKKINPGALVTHKYPLIKIDEALRKYRENRDEVMKILLYPDNKTPDNQGH